MASDTESQLFQLCTDGNLPTLKYLTTKQGLNPNEVKDFSGLTLLHLACQNGHLDIVLYLINDQDCKPETTTPDGRTPLHTACKTGHLHIVKCLINDHKCNPHCTDNDGYTPLHAASESGNIETVKYLITEQGCDPQVDDSIGNTPLHYACESGHLHIVQELITNFKCDPQKTNSRGSIPLHIACRGGQTAVARYLINEHQCNPNCTNMFGLTSLHLACSSGCLHLVKYLIDELDCNPQNVSIIGLTPLHYACLYGHLDITKYLISDCNCNPQCSDNSGNTPLHGACQNGHLEVAKYLITEQKCNPDHGNVNGCTPLHSATSNGHLAVVKYLITQHNCNPQCSDNDGCTPLHVACAGRHLHIVKYLIHVQKCPCEPEARINPQLQKKVSGIPQEILPQIEGVTPLLFASILGYLEIVKYLIDVCKCNPNHSTSNGLTAIDLAQLYGHKEVVSYLRNEHQCSKNLGQVVTKFMPNFCGVNCDSWIENFNDMCLSPLDMACINGNLEAVKLFSTGYNCNSSSTSFLGITPLHIACMMGHVEIAKYLITEHKYSEIGCNPHVADNNGLTPLHFACLNGHLDITKYLISDCNCNPQCSANNGDTPLHCACHNGHLEVAKHLIAEHKCSPEHGNVNGYTPLHSAANNGHLAIVKYLINELGCNAQITDNNGLTPLHYACLNGHLDVTKYFISDCNCNPQCSTKNGDTPLHHACQEGHLEVPKYLITEHKCSPEHGNVNGFTPLHLAASNGHLALVKYLISELGCNAQITTNDGITPLHFACLNGHLHITKYLISDCNCNPQCTANNGNTPLHCACQEGHLEVAKYLITEHKCSPEHGNVDGSTPLHSATSNGHLTVVKYLITQHNCNPQCSDNNGITPLHEACASGHLHVAKYLIQEKNCACEPVARISDPIKYFLPHIFEHFETELRVFKGITPLHVASDGGHLDTVKYLIDVCKCNPNHPTSHGLTAIDFAQRQGHQKVVVYLRNEHQCGLSLGQVVSSVKSHCLCTFWGLNSDYLDSTCIDVNDMCISHLQRACFIGNLAAVKRCATKSDFNPSAGFLGGFTLLNAACMMGHLEIAKYLVTECECDPGTPTYFNNVLTTPLYLATLFGQLKVIRWLITEQNCEPVYFDSECEYYIPLVILACQCGHLSVIKYLLSECNSKDFEISNLLVFACWFGHLNVVKYLIKEFKCNPRVRDNDGITPLHLACAGIQYFKEREYHMSAKNTPFIVTIQSILHILLAIVSLPTSLFKNVLPKFLPGFLNSDNKLSDYDITSGARSADHNQNTRNHEEQATPYDLRCLNVVKYLITEHNCNPQCTDKEGETPLHYACGSGHLEIVQYFHSEKLGDLVHTTHSGDTPLHFACKSNQEEIVKFLLSTGECDPLIKNVEGLTPVELASSTEICEQLDHFCKGNYPLESVVKVFVLGDPMAGKSSLVQAIQSSPGFLGSLLGRFQRVKGVRQQTAGINSFSFSSSDFGNVVIYDFAGQREFYTSHAAFLQNSSSVIPGIFILVTDIALCEDDIYQTLQYWVLFIEECCAHVQSKTKPYIIFVGSHVDQLNKGDVEQAFMLIHKCFAEDSDNKFYEMSEVICLDCTRPSSVGLDLLRYHLKESCNSIRERREKIDQRCYVLHKYVHKEYINIGIHGCKLKNISKDLEDNSCLLPSTSSELLPLLQTLHDRGQVIFLRNKHILGNSWVITNIAAMLETVVGSIFAPRDFPQHIAPGSTGIVPKSRITEAFPDINIDMIIGFLEHFEFCHRVGLDWVIQSKHEVSDTNDVYYLFPALVTLENIPQVLRESHENHYYCGWLIHCTAKHQFFTIRLLYVLLLRLAFLFALPQDIAIPTASEVETPVLKRSCTMWKSGITWHDTNGVSTHFEVRELKTVILIMSSMKGSEIHCVKLRTQLIKTILQARKEFCPRVDVEECIMKVESEGLVQTIQKCPSQCTKYSLKYLSDRISTRDASDHQDLVLVNPDGSPGKRISELLYFEPYTLLTSDLITQMFSRHTSSLIVSDAFLSEVAARFYLCKNILSQILMPQPRLLSEKLKMDVYSLDSLDEMSKHLKCVHILEAWMEQQESPATYRKLRQELNKYSIFCGRNPLDLSGECGESSDESGDDERRDDDKKERSSCDDEADRPTLIECVRFRGRERRINIPQEIGVKYHDFGLFLLEDDTGTRIRSITHKHNNDAEQINMEVIRQWITGRGKHPVTWTTLTQCLRDTELTVLAGEIEAIKCHTNRVEKNGFSRKNSAQKPLRDVSTEGLSNIPHEVSEDSPVQRSLRESNAETTEDQNAEALEVYLQEMQKCSGSVATETTEGSRSTNIGASGFGDDKNYEAIKQIADIVCSCVEHLKEKERNQRSSAHCQDNEGPLVQGDPRDIAAEVSKGAEQRKDQDVYTSCTDDHEAVQKLVDIAAGLPFRCSELLEALEDNNSASHGGYNVSPVQRAQRDKTAEVIVGSEQRDIPASDFQHNSQQIVDVAADLLSKCFELEALNLEREEDQRSSEGIEDRVDAAANVLYRYFEVGLVSCEDETQGSSAPHEISEDPPVERGLKHTTAMGTEPRGTRDVPNGIENVWYNKALKQITDVAADLLHKCFKLLDTVSPNQTHREIQGKSVSHGEQGGNGNIPVRDTKLAKCREALQHIADIAADVLYGCFVLLELQSSHQEKEENQESSAHLKIGDRQQNISLIPDEVLD